MMCTQSIRRYLTVALLVLVVTCLPNRLGASISTEGDLLPPYPGGGDWLLLGSDLKIGDTAAGSLTIDAGSSVTVADNAVYLGFGPGVEGSATITEPNSLLDVSGDVVVGAWGDGVLSVSAGAMVDGENLYIGGFPLVDTSGFDPNMLADFGAVEGTGSVTVTGADSLLTASGPGTLAVGASGTGTLTISDGGQVEAATMYVGGVDVNNLGGGGSDWGLGDPTGIGTVTVTGAGSTLQIFGADTLFLGYTGEGYLTVADQGVVADDYGVIGTAAGSMGQATVTGEGSQWVHAEDFVVGAWGTGQLAITNGGLVENYNGYVGGFDPDSFDIDVEELGEPNGVGVVLVSGAGTQWTNEGDLFVGYGGTGTLDVNDGAQVSAYDAYLGYLEGSQGVARVSDANSQWDVEGNLYVGPDAAGPGGSGLLSIRAGGRVSVGETLWIRGNGTLMGNGTVDASMVDNYGIIAPGNSVGTLTVNGDVTFEPNSIYEVEIGPGDASDRIVASEDVNITGGTVKVIPVATVTGTRQYEIIEANSVTGTFDTLDTALLHFYFRDTDLEYDPNSVWLWVDVRRFDDPNFWRTNNEREVGEALQQIAEGGGTTVTDALQQLEDANDIRRSYDQLSGQSRPPLAPLTISATSRFLGMVTSRVQTIQSGLAGMSESSLFAMGGLGGSLNSGGMGEARPRGQTFAVGRGSSTLADRAWGVWGQGYGLFGDRETEEDGVPGYSYSMYGGSLGLDYQLTEKFLAGIIGGYSQGDVTFAGLRDKTDIAATHVGLYGSLADEKCYLDAVATYVGLEYDTERFVDLLSERLTGSFDGSELAAYLEAGLNWDWAANLRLQPLASVQYTYLSLDSYTESGGASALTFDEQTYESIKGALGARLTGTLLESAGDFRADVQLRGRWVHEFGDNHSTVDAAFANSPAAVFTVEDKAISRGSAVLGAGVHADLNRQTRAYVDYDTRLNSDETVHVISAALQYRW